MIPAYLTTWAALSVWLFSIWEILIVHQFIFLSEHHITFKNSTFFCGHHQFSHFNYIFLVSTNPHSFLPPPFAGPLPLAPCNSPCQHARTVVRSFRSFTITQSAEKRKKQRKRKLGKKEEEVLMLTKKKCEGHFC